MSATIMAAVLAIALQAAGGPQYPPGLADQLDAVRAATERFRDHRVAVEEGYRLIAGDGPLMGEHWVRYDLVHEPFDITRPSTLQYLRIGDDYLLTGVAYTVYRAPDDPLPEGFVGDQDQWHVHDMLKIAMTATEDRPLLRWITERRIANGRTQWDPEEPQLTMVHAWVWEENPDGVFAQDHRLIPYPRAGLPRDWGIDASVDAAYGIALLSDDACDQEVRRSAFLTAASRRQRRELAAACYVAQGFVRSARNGLEPEVESASAGEVAQLNALAERAWQGYLRRRGEILTAEQVERLAVAIEHPGGQHGEHRH